MAKAKQHLGGWLIMLPGIALFTFFLWVPLLQSVRMSFYRTVNIELVEFVGLQNYISIFGRQEFQQALRNTFVYTGWSLLIGFLVPIFLALVIGETLRGRGFFRTAAYLPNILPGLAAMILFSRFFSAEPTGVINIIMSWIDRGPFTFLTETNMVIPIIVLVSTWRGAGATALIYMAGLAGINPELYEAATIDGAGIFRRIRHITIPAIFNLGSTLLILQIIAVFQIMYEPMVLTAGGPDNASLSLMLYMWNLAFSGVMDMGRASAVAVITALILLCFTALYSFVNKRRTEWE
ncbi:MAG: sugar ABC transporter permease [Defluviitaleaceae bacterium]|nr:sugar ABC transporter permease [Defluviitaleaceae bacterium]MCL2274464.1 sugar ABC transporter permease [Defluviitaleaceae bacterium]